MRWLFALALLSGPAWADDFACPDAPPPVIALDYGSRYQDDDASRSEIDADADRTADEALEPVETFLRDLTQAVGYIHRKDADQPAIADCVIGAMAEWADAGALTDLRSDTANLTIGSRIAGFALVTLQAAPHATRDGQVDAIKGWLAGLMRTQMVWWEGQSPRGARQGNLRAWAALAGSTVAALTDDPVIRAWSAWSVDYVLCSAAPDGSLPQEMRRGKRALHYQLHALAPLTVSVVELERQGIDLKDVCDGALQRAARFAIDDLGSGAATQAITGEVQTFFDGTDQLEEWHLAWLEAYVAVFPGEEDGQIGAWLTEMRPMGYSKLGGNQTAMWGAD
jgi:poly(beta-D-mannuronate) lyase